MPRISQLPAKTTPASGDEIAIVEVATSTTKKITRADLLKGADLPNDTVTTGAIKNGAVTTDKIDLTTLNFTAYNTAELDTGLKYVDGKTIYSRTISGTTTSAAGARTNSPLFTVTGLGRIISCDGWWYIGFTGIDNIIPGADSAGRTSSVVRLGNDINLITTTEQPRTAAPYTVRVFYTKV